MSQSRMIRYTCPYCGKTFETEIYDSVTADTDEDLRDRCVSGDLFRISCPKCKREFMIQYPLVYVDRRHRFVIWLKEEEPGAETVKALAGPLAPAGFRLRRVTTLQEFVEKIQIFEDEVDDRLVELAKYDSLIEFIDNRKGTAEDVTSIDYQKTENGFLLFYTISDYLVFFTTICCQARKRKVRLYGIAPMQDHFHLMADAERREAVCDFMRDSTSQYALNLNASLHSSGKIFHKAFGCAQKKGSKAIRTCASYLYNNAGEKKLCSRAEDYRWTFLAYAKSKHPFSEPLVHKDASRAFRRIIKMVDYYSKAGVPLEYNWLGRWFSELDGVERQQLIDYIIVSYNCIDYEKLFSYYDNSYDTACLAFARHASFNSSFSFDALCVFCVTHSLSVHTRRFPAFSR